MDYKQRPEPLELIKKSEFHFEESQVGMMDLVTPKKDSSLPDIVSPEKRPKFVVHELIEDESPRNNDITQTFAIHTNLAASMDSIELAPHLGNKP